MFPSNQESLPQIYPRDPLHPSLSSSLVRLNQWHNNRLSHTLEDIGRDVKLKLSSHNWNQQQFFMSHVFNADGELKYGPNSHKSLTRVKLPPVRNKSHKASRASETKAQSVAILRGGLFSNTRTPVSSVPRTQIRHDVAKRTLRLEERDLQARRNSHVYRENILHDLITPNQAMDVIQESNFRLKLSHKSKSNQDEIIHMKRDQSVRGQTEKFISETQKLFTHPKRVATQSCDDRVLWQIVSKLPTKYLRKAYESSYQLIESRQRDLIACNKRRMDTLTQSSKQI